MFAYIASMKMNLAAKISLLAILALAATLITGCKTTPPVDWNSRVGTYTFDQAVIELGPPDKQAKLSDGKTVAEWITHYYNNSGFSVGTGFFNGPAGVGVVQSTGSSGYDKILTLTFDTGGKLVSWSKNYH
jgi:hypothetical protein